MVCFEYYVLGTSNFALMADGYDFTAPIEQIGDEKISYTVRTTPIMYSKGGVSLDNWRHILVMKILKMD